MAFSHPSLRLSAISCYSRLPQTTSSQIYLPRIIHCSSAPPHSLGQALCIGRSKLPVLRVTENLCLLCIVISLWCLQDFMPTPWNSWLLNTCIWVFLNPHFQLIFRSPGRKEEKLFPDPLVFPMALFLPQSFRWKRICFSCTFPPQVIGTSSR